MGAGPVWPSRAIRPVAAMEMKMKLATISVGTKVIRAKDRSRWLDGRVALRDVQWGIVRAVVYSETRQRCSEVTWEDGTTQLCDNRDLRRA